MVKYAVKPDTPAKCVMCKGTDLRVSYKNTYETVTTIKGMYLLEARRYLEDVIAKRRCVPFRRYNGGVGRTAKAREFKLTQGRFPQKSCRVLLDLLQNAESNCDMKGLDVERLMLTSAVITHAPFNRRRVFRAYGRITPFKSQPCNIQLIFKEIEDDVEQPKSIGHHSVIKLTKRQLASRKLRVGAKR
ncbi:60s ribosomal protein L17 [Cryptosporidium andersoni]|uniref:60s ribosomal protein L17 n=1 Tax=Cryptosporidium andersoni TaxID=117008 RepID=A0A1J4MLP3_9CRYT|nr:60s ribosomal protein L17 [Cryptosporidium andersoni]